MIIKETNAALTSILGKPGLSIIVLQKMAKIRLVVFEKNAEMTSPIQKLVYFNNQLTGEISVSDF